MLDIVSRRMCNSAGFDSFASKNEGEIIELNRDISFEEVVVERDFR